MIIDLEKAMFFTDGRYHLQSKEEVPDNIIVEIVKDYNSIFKEKCSKYKKMLLQPSCQINISSKILDENVEIFLDENNFLLKHRMIKDEQEISLIKEQYTLAGSTFLRSLNLFKYDTSEKSWAAALEYHMKMLGAKGESFETIVASGVRSAMPHGCASSKKVKENEPVIVDFGSRLDYTSDYTRMIYSGNDIKVLEVIDIVKNALLKAIDNVTIGKTTGDIDNVARSFIESNGYGKYFNHSLGHGVGIDVHELPYIKAGGDIILEDNMVFTIEPGIYLPDRFGVRLEETVAIRNGKPEVISNVLDKYVYVI